tara:strand:+ start:278 stop:463 length:186 start_codon:yes stop_codon:yes gene_type:complete
MNVTNAQYQSLKIENTVVEAQHAIIATIDNVKMFVPIQANNRHYKAIQEWVAKGNTIADAE